MSIIERIQIAERESDLKNPYALVGRLDWYALENEFGLRMKEQPTYQQSFNGFAVGGMLIKELPLSCHGFLLMEHQDAAKLLNMLASGEEMAKLLFQTQNLFQQVRAVQSLPPSKTKNHEHTQEDQPTRGAAAEEGESEAGKPA